MTINILLVVLFISAIVISILVLLQNKGGDMGSAFGGGSNTLFGARGSADFLSRGYVNHSHDLLFVGVGFSIYIC